MIMDNYKHTRKWRDVNPHVSVFWAPLVAQLVKNLPAMQETPV